ncbi:flavin reductase family protein [Alginatibacterium sediminis]|nr:flavin reductase family protein [Alginatibacterium sediminis]
MIIDLNSLSTNESYHLLTQVIVPRPIAWVLTENQDSESYNLAPFSFFNAVCSDPPLIMLSIGQRPDGRQKDTLDNIQRSKKVTIHIPSVEHAAEVTESSRSREPNDSEINAQNIKLVDFEGFALPRIENSKIALAGELHLHQTIGRQQQNLVFIELKTAYLESSIVSKSDQRLKVDHLGLDPLGRLGGSDYWVNGHSLTIKRPM